MNVSYLILLQRLNNFLNKRQKISSDATMFTHNLLLKLLYMYEQDEHKLRFLYFALSIIKKIESLITSSCEVKRTFLKY